MRLFRPRLWPWCIALGVLVPPVAAGQEAVIQRPGGEVRLQFGFLAQLDARNPVDDRQNVVSDTLTQRRFRPVLQGTLTERFGILVHF